MKTEPNTPIQTSKGAMSFLIMALIFLCVSTLWIALKPTLFLDSGSSVPVRAWTYLTLYGFVMPAVFGLIGLNF